MSLEVNLVVLHSNLEKLGLPRILEILEILHTCDWTSSTAEDELWIGSLQDVEIDFELYTFDDDKLEGSERDVEYMEIMMAMLISARGILYLEWLEC